MKPKESISKVWFQTDQSPNSPSIQKGKNRLSSALMNEAVPAFCVTLQMIQSFKDSVSFMMCLRFLECF